MKKTNEEGTSDREWNMKKDRREGSKEKKREEERKLLRINVKKEAFVFRGHIRDWYTESKTMNNALALL